MTDAELERLISRSLGGVGQANTGGLGRSLEGLAGLFPQPIPALTSIVTGMVKAPLEAVAGAAENSARQLAAMNTRLGTVAVAYEKQIQTLRYIPFIGDALSRIQEAELKEMEVRQSFVDVFNPAAAKLRDYAQDAAKAAEGALNIGETRGQASAGWASSTATSAMRDLFHQSGVDPSAWLPLQKAVEHETWAKNHPILNWLTQRWEAEGGEPFTFAKSGVRDQALMDRMMRLQNIREEITSTKVWPPGLKEDFMRRISEIVPNAQPILPARPAALDSFQQYAEKLWVGAFSQGASSDPTTQTADNTRQISETVVDVFLWLREQVERLTAQDVANP